MDQVGQVEDEVKKDLYSLDLYSRLDMDKLYIRARKCLLLILILLLLILSCSKSNDVNEINNLIRVGSAQAEKHDIVNLMDLAKDDFVGMPGELNLLETRGVLWRSFNYYKTFKILYPKPEIAIEENGQKASAMLPFLIVKEDHAFKKLKDLFEDPKQWVEEAGKSADIYGLELELVKSDGNWLVQRARISKYI